MSERWSTKALIGTGLAGITLSFLGSQVTFAQQESANRALLADYDAKQAVVESYADEVRRLHAEKAMTEEVLTQAVRIYEDGSVSATTYHWDGTDLVPTHYDFCVDGALCDDDEPTTVAPGA